MDFSLSAEQQMLQETARRFAQTELPAHATDIENNNNVLKINKLFTDNSHVLVAILEFGAVQTRANLVDLKKCCSVRRFLARVVANTAENEPSNIC